MAGRLGILNHGIQISKFLTYCSCFFRFEKSCSVCPGVRTSQNNQTPNSKLPTPNSNSQQQSKKTGK
jgi:hypothetical protein